MEVYGRHIEGHDQEGGQPEVQSDWYVLVWEYSVEESSHHCDGEVGQMGLAMVVVHLEMYHHLCRMYVNHHQESEMEGWEVDQYRNVQVLQDDQGIALSI